MGEINAGVIERLARLEALEQIEDVVLNYARAHDLHDAELLASCFAPSARWIFQGKHVYEGVESIVACISQFFDTGWSNSTHMVGRPSIALDGTRATVQTFCIAGLAEAPGGRVLVRGILYTDEFVERDGRWLIDVRLHEPKWMMEGTSVVPGSVLATADGS